MLNVLRDTLIDIIKREVASKLASQFPFLFTGPLNIISKFFINKAVVWLVENVSLFLEIKAMEMKTRNQVEEVISIIAKYKNLNPTEKEKEVLDAALEEASFKLIRFDY